MAYSRQFSNEVGGTVLCAPKSYGPTEEMEREIPQAIQRLESGLSDLSEAIDLITERLLPAMAVGQDTNRQGSPVHSMGTALGGVLQEQVNRVSALNEHLRDVWTRLQL